MEGNMKLAIYGAGSMGTVLGAYIAKSGQPIDLINRNREHVQGLNAKGAQITGTVNMAVPVNALLPEEMNAKYDIIFLLTKQLENKTVLERLKNYLKEDGVICTLQNGIPELSVAEVIGEKRTFGCSVAWGATMLGHGVCELTSAPDSLSFSLGSLSPAPDREKLRRIKVLLECMGAVECEENFIGGRWSKLLVNSAFSGMSAVLGATFGEAAKNKKARFCIQKIGKECIDVAKKANIHLAPIQGKDICKLLDYQSRLKQKLSFMLIPLMIRKHRRLKASMLQDLEKGKKTEVDAINGVVCDDGKTYGVPTPYNDLVRHLVHEIEDGRLRPEMENLRFFEALLKNPSKTEDEKSDP
jgi:2-dehydropantoate 2-reductase